MFQEHLRLHSDSLNCTFYLTAGAPNYFPNSFSGPQDDLKYAQHEFPLTGDVARYNTKDDDNFTQPGIFWRDVLTADDRTALIGNIASHLKDAADFIQKRAVSFMSTMHSSVIPYWYPWFFPTLNIYPHSQWLSHLGCKGGRVPPLTAKKIAKNREEEGKKSGKRGEKRGEIGEKKAQIGKVFSLCPS